MQAQTQATQVAVMGRGIGTPYGNELEQGIADAHAVTGGKGETYMQGFENHFRAKFMTPDDVRYVDNGRLEAGEGLDGNGREGKNCCIRDKDLSRMSMGGPNLNTAVYRCGEVCIGECKWRTCAEPVTACIYRIDHRITVRNISEGQNAVPKSILINACIRQEAHDEADIAMSS